MTRVPAASITLGNQRFDVQALETSACLALLPAASSFRVVLPPAADPRGGAGDAAVLSLDGGDGPETVLSGRIRHVRRGVRATEVLAADAGADLGALRPSATFERQAARDVIRALCSDAGVQAERLDLDLDLAAYVAHPFRTAAEHVAELSRMAGASAAVGPDGALVVAPWPEGRPAAALRYGREIVALERRDRAPPAAATYLVGYGPAGTAEAPDALRHTTTVIPGGTPDPSPDTRWIAAPILRTPRAGQAATRARQAELAAQAVSAKITCFLLPKLRPGMEIEIQDLPERLSSGTWLLTRVTHRIARGTASTVLEARSATAGAGRAGLVAAGLSALGGLP